MIWSGSVKYTDIPVQNCSTNSAKLHYKGFLVIGDKVSHFKLNGGENYTCSYFINMKMQIQKNASCRKWCEQPLWETLRSLFDCVSCFVSWLHSYSPKNWTHHLSYFYQSEQHILFLISGVIQFSFGHFATFCSSVILLCFFPSLSVSFSFFLTQQPRGPSLLFLFFPHSSYVSLDYFSWV